MAGIVKNCRIDETIITSFSDGGHRSSPVIVLICIQHKMIR